MSLRTVLALTLPGAVALGPAAALLVLAPDSWSPAAYGSPYAALALVAVLAWRFQRSRIVAAAATLALAGAVAGGGLAVDHPAAAYLSLALLAPLLALVACTADRRVGSPRGLAQLAAAPLTAAAGAVVLLSEPEGVARWMEWTLVAPEHTAWTAVPQGALATAGLGLATLAVVALQRARALEAGLFWAALAGTLAVAAPLPAATGAWLLGAGAALGVALVESAHALAFRDELTDLPGRRALRSLLSSLRPPYSIAIVDVDRFKSFNDRYGHDVGDQVLRMVAGKLRAVGGGGRPFRSGGEEFTIVFPGTTRDDAAAHLDALRRAVADAVFVLRGRRRPRGAKGAARRGSGGGSARRLRVTVSIGVAQAGERRVGVDEVVKSADKAMYRAKQKGRNRVMA